VQQHCSKCDRRKPGQAAAPHDHKAFPRVCAQAKKVDYTELPQPVRYEELQREVMSEPARGWGLGGQAGCQAVAESTGWGPVIVPAMPTGKVPLPQLALLQLLLAVPHAASTSGVAAPHAAKQLLPAAAAGVSCCRCQRQSIMLLLLAVSLKPDLFEGLRFDLTKPLNHNFALSHSIFMGNIDVPTANPQQVGSAPCWAPEGSPTSVCF